MTYNRRIRPADRQDGRDRAAYYQAYYQANKERLKATRKPAADRAGEHYRTRYGITIAQYDAKLADQGGVCAICGKPPKRARLHVDHNHKTGHVRGILCAACNGALHYLENTHWLRAAADYLERHQDVAGDAELAE